MQVGLKERLIGAAVLVIIAAIVIPWVLKGHSTPGGPTVNKPLALPATSNSGPVQTYRLPLDSSATTAAGASSTIMPASPQGSKPLLQGRQATSGPQAQTSAATASAPVPQPEAQPAAPVVAPKARPAPGSAPAAHAPATPAHGKWVVQAGSYDSERAALAVERKLAAHGYRAYVSRFSSKGRTFYRVRVGPYASRDEAAGLVAGVSRAAGAKAAVMPNS